MGTKMKLYHGTNLKFQSCTMVYLSSVYGISLLPHLLYNDFETLFEWRLEKKDLLVRDVNQKIQV